MAGREETWRSRGGVEEMWRLHCGVEEWSGMKWRRGGGDGVKEEEEKK